MTFPSDSEKRDESSLPAVDDPHGLCLELLVEIAALGMVGAVELGAAPPGTLSHWATRVTDLVIATGPRRDHWRGSHPELQHFGLEAQIILAILDPDEVHRDRDANRSYSAVFFRAIDLRNDIAVVVSVSHRTDRANSIITARKQRSAIRRKNRSKLCVWKRD